MNGYSLQLVGTAWCVSRPNGEVIFRLKDTDVVYASQLLRNLNDPAYEPED